LGKIVGPLTRNGDIAHNVGLGTHLPLQLPKGATDRNEKAIGNLITLNTTPLKNLSLIHA